MPARRPGMHVSDTDRHAQPSEAIRIYRGPSDRVHRLANALLEAPAVSVVTQRSADVRALAIQLFDEGMSAVHLTRIVAELNDLVTRRLLSLIAVEHKVQHLRWCWMALGSEGRLEQTIHTDQDNAIIFHDALAEEAHARLLPFARAVNQALARAGFRLCPGDIMAGNPRWCLSDTAWQRRFAEWVDTGDPEALLHGAIFFDFRGLYGDLSLVESLREWLSGYIADRPLFLRQMSENAMRTRPPLGLFGALSPLSRPFPKRRTIDIKLRGVSPFSDAARILALSRGLRATNSSDRLLHWARTPSEKRQAESWTRALAALQTYRLQRQMACAKQGLPMDNAIDTHQLSHFDRAVMRAALVEARETQRHLSISYQLTP